MDRKNTIKLLGDLQLVGEGPKYAIRLAIEDMKKQIAEPVIDAKHIEFSGSIKSQFKSGHCPHCNEYVDSDYDPNFCSKCGQKLDWQDLIVLDSLPILSDKV